MGGISRTYPCEETFTPVAQFIAEKYRDAGLDMTPKIIIHTANPAGAMRIAGHLNGGNFIVERKESVPANRLEPDLMIQATESSRASIGGRNPEIVC